LLSILEEQDLGEERIQTILELAKYVRDGILEAEDNFKKRRWVIETLDLSGTISVEDSQKVLYLTCVTGEDRLSLGTHSS